jgi:hypothetical protein
LLLLLPLLLPLLLSLFFCLSFPQGICFSDIQLRVKSESRRIATTKM